MVIYIKKLFKSLKKYIESCYFVVFYIQKQCQRAQCKFTYKLQSECSLFLLYIKLNDINLKSF